MQLQASARRSREAAASGVALTCHTVAAVGFSTTCSLREVELGMGRQDRRDLHCVPQGSGDCVGQGGGDEWGVGTVHGGGMACNKESCIGVNSF